MPTLTLLPKTALLVLTLFFYRSAPLKAAATPSDVYGVGFGAEELEPRRRTTRILTPGRQGRLCE